MISIMSKNGIDRILTIGTGGILTSRVEPELLRYQSSETKRKSTVAAIEHHRVYNKLKESSLKMDNYMSHLFTNWRCNKCVYN